MPAQPELQRALTDWTKRVNFVRGQGVDPGAVTELAKKDLEHVKQTGSSRYGTVQEASDAVYAAYRNKSAIGAPGRGHGLLDLFGNAGADIGNIVNEFVPSVVHMATDVGNANKWGQQIKMLTASNAEKQSMGLESTGEGSNPFDWNWGAAFRNLAKEPLTRYLPGIWTGSSSWEEKMQHPVMSLLDVVPFLDAGSSVATAGVEKGAEGSAMAALQEGHPFKAFAKKTGLSDATSSWLAQHWQGAAPNMAVWKLIGAQRRIAEYKFRNVVHDLHESGVLQEGLPGSKVAQLTEDAVTYNKRFETPATEVHDISQIRSIPRDTDVKAYVRDDAKFGDDVLLSFTPHDELTPVRVRAGDIDPRTMVTKADKVLPDKVYAAEDVAQIQKIRGHLEAKGYQHSVEPGHRWSAKEGAVVADKPPLLRVPNGKGGFELFPGKSEVGKSYNAWQKAVKRADTLTQKMHDVLEEELYRGDKVSVGASSKLIKLQEQVKEAGVQASRHEGSYWSTLGKNPSARFIPMLQDLMKAKAIEQVSGEAIGKMKTQLHGENLAAAAENIDTNIQEMVQRISATTSAKEINGILGKKTYEAIYEDTIGSWTQLIDKGYDPLWLHFVDPSGYESLAKGHISPLPMKEPGMSHPGMWKDKAFNFQPAIMDMQVAITDVARQEIREQATRQTLESLMNTGVLVRKSNLEREIMQSLVEKGVKPGEGKNMAHLVAQEINRTHAEFNPAQYTIPGLRMNSKETWVMPKVIKRGFDRLIDKDHLVPAKGVWDKTMNVWRFSVLTGPRHMVHVGMGGLMMMMGDSPDALLDVGAAKNLMKGYREGTLDAEVAAGIFKGHSIESADAEYALRAGRSIGRMQAQEWVKKGAKVADKLNQFEDYMSNMQRAMVYARDLRKGVDAEEALNHINRVFVDMDNLTPFERTTLRQVFPFWVFTKHIMRYVLAYPADHPVRAAILSRAVNQFEKDWATGMPKRFMQLFFLGEPDKNGNVTSVDMRNLNPFRSMYSVFSMQGFLQGSNPAVAMGAKALGINPLTSTPELFNGLHYDDFTGSLQANRPSIGIGDVASSIIPEFSAVDHFIGLTDQMRRLKKYSPEGYRRQLLSSMNLPFTTSETNVFDARASAETNRYRAAQKVVTQAWQTGNTTELKRWQLVPWQGQLVDSSVLADYIERYVKAAPGVSPKAVYRPIRKRKDKRVL